MIVDIKLHHPDALPTRGTEGSAGFDLRAIYQDVPYMLQPGDTASFATGIAIHLQQKGYAAIVLPRSGLGTKGIVLTNTIGLIDSDYTGEIKVFLTNRGAAPFQLEPRERIAQLVVIPVIRPVWHQVEEHVPSERGANGFGHTGRT
jgi:dUTP pyrophosphatase